MGDRLGSVSGFAVDVARCRDTILFAEEPLSSTPQNRLLRWRMWWQRAQSRQVSGRVNQLWPLLSENF
jgi:hypothetical protein